MEDLFDSLMRGNVPQVKAVLTTVALALGAYQLVLIAVGYGKVRLGGLGARAVAGGLLGLVLLAKVAVVRRGLGLGSALPLFGITVFAAGDDDHGGGSGKQEDSGGGHGSD